MRFRRILAGIAWLVLLLVPVRQAPAAAPRAVKKLVTKPAAAVARKAKKIAAPKGPATRDRVVANKKSKAPVFPARPPADLPEVTQAASVWEGCLGTSDLSGLASKLEIEEARLGSVLEDLDVMPQPQSECVPYMAATGGEGGAASATFQRVEPVEGKAPAVAIHRSADGVVATPAACDCPEASRRVVTFPVVDMNDPANPAVVSVPLNIRWQLDILVPRMVAKLAAGADSLTARVVLERAADPNPEVETDGLPDPEHLQSVEVLDSVSGNRLDGAWWLERAAAPGVLIGMDGVAYERALWQTPVKYRYQSRGVGPRTRTVRQKANGGKGEAAGKAQVRTVRTGGYHLGVDMMAVKGTDVHAVSDARVSFAGRKGGFGKLVILDHGMGYQTYYAHLSVIPKEIREGAVIARGQIIGLVGSTGRSTAPHLHFEARKNGIYFDPFDNSHEPEFWLLSADDQERLAMRLLNPPAEQGRPSPVAQNSLDGPSIP